MFIDQEMFTPYVFFVLVLTILYRNCCAVSLLKFVSKRLCFERLRVAAHIQQIIRAQIRVLTPKLIKQEMSPSRNHCTLALWNVTCNRDQSSIVHENDISHPLPPQQLYRLHTSLPWKKTLLVKIREERGIIGSIKVSRKRTTNLPPPPPPPRLSQYFALSEK